MLKLVSCCKFNKKGKLNDSRRIICWKMRWINFASRLKTHRKWNFAVVGVKKGENEGRGRKLVFRGKEIWFHFVWVVRKKLYNFFIMPPSWNEENAFNHAGRKCAYDGQRMELGVYFFGSVMKRKEKKTWVQKDC